jgi:hypothetical protein
MVPKMMQQNCKQKFKYRYMQLIHPTVLLRIWIQNVYQFCVVLQTDSFYYS